MSSSSLHHAFSEAPTDQDAYQGYVDFLEEVYQKMNENYYQPVAREIFDSFVNDFEEKIYPQLQDTKKSSDFIRWRSASFLVERLKSEEDIFSTFYPPKPAKEYKRKALGKRVDLGITGEKTDYGYMATHVEPRSDAYEKGLRENDVIIMIDEQKTLDIDAKEINNLLNPLIHTTLKLTYLNVDRESEQTIEVTSKEYFKQTVFLVPTKAPGVFCLQLQRFNRKTSEDMTVLLNFIRRHSVINGIILDLRGNPGGPPLAAREISSFFLPGGEDFAYFQKRGEPKALLDVPVIPQKFKYDGPLVILVDKKSGSAAELFSGILQRRERAVLIGKNTAGQVMLKSMFHFDDDSMVLLITARGHHPDGQVFSFNGITPNRSIGDDEDVDLIEYASVYLVYGNK